MKDNLTLIMMIVIVGAVGGYIYWQQQELNKARMYKNDTIVREIETLVRKRETMIKEIDSLTAELESENLLNERLKREVAIYKKQSDDYYQQWKQYKMPDESDTSIANLLALLRSIASASDTSASPVDP